MQNESKIDRPYSVDVICPIGKGLRLTLKNYSEKESSDLIKKLTHNKARFQINILLEMVEHEYLIYPSDKIEEVREGKWFGIN